MRRGLVMRWSLVAGILASGAVIASLLEHTGAGARRPTPSFQAATPAPSIDALFSSSVSALRSGRYRRAEVLLRELLQRAPALPEGHVNHGYALLALHRPAAARAAFMRALELRPRQANAYYGLGIAEDTLGDRDAALGAMRSYLHLAPPSAPHVRMARAAIWEWQSPSTDREQGRDRSPPRRDGTD